MIMVIENGKKRISRLVYNEESKSWDHVDIWIEEENE